MLPETIGNVTVLTAKNRASAFCLDGAENTAETDPESRPSMAIVGLNILYQLPGEPLCLKNAKVTGKKKRNPP